VRRGQAGVLLLDEFLLLFKGDDFTQTDLERAS
jgi:uncharacterized protein with PIN domain